MFTRKNALISLAVAAFLVGCGGGGGGGTTPTQSSNTNTGGTNTGGTNTTVTATSDAKLASAWELGGDLVIGSQAADNLPIAIGDFTSNTPRPANAEFCANTYGVCGWDGNAANVPLSRFGYRLKPVNGEAAAESKVGRIVFELQDQGTAASKEVLQIMVDKVTLSQAAGGALSVSQAADSKVYVYAKNAAGQTANASATAPANVVSMIAVPSDTGARDLILNIDAAVAAAKAAATGTNASVLGSVKDFKSGAATPFEVAMTLSQVKLTRADGTTALAGKPITVTNSGVAGVADGGGVAKGYVQVGE